MAEPPLASQGLEAIAARHNGPASALAPIKQGAPWPRQSRASLGRRLLLVVIVELALAGLQWSMQGLARGLPDRSKRASLLDSNPQGCPWGSPASAHGLRYWLLLSRCRRMVHPWTCPDGTAQASALGSREKPGGPSSGPRWVGRWPRQPIGFGGRRTPWPGRDGALPFRFAPLGRKPGSPGRGWVAGLELSLALVASCHPCLSIQIPQPSR